MLSCRQFIQTIRSHVRLSSRFSDKSVVLFFLPNADVPLNTSSCNTYMGRSSLSAVLEHAASFSSALLKVTSQQKTWKDSAADESCSSWQLVFTFFYCCRPRPFLLGFGCGNGKSTKREWGNPLIVPRGGRGLELVKRESVYLGEEGGARYSYEKCNRINNKPGA